MPLATVEMKKFLGAKALQLNFTTLLLRGIPWVDLAIGPFNSI